MAKYIDADNLLKRLRARKQRYYEQGEAKEFDAVVSCIVALETEPTADAEPVKRGKWQATEWKGTCGGEFHEKACSHCKEYAYIDVDDEFSFCPYCGAKMEGVTE